MSSWAWLANGRLWGAAALVGVLTLSHCAAYRQGGAGARVDLAELQAAHAEQGRVAALARAQEQEQARGREAALQAQIDKEAHDGQHRVDVARADADRAGAELYRLREQLARYRAAIGGPATPAQSAAAGPPAEGALDLLADLLSGSAGALVEVARFADAAHAAGITCERSADALSAPAVSLFP